jgi:hypothetical protein
MNSGIGELLREGIERVTAAERLGPGLTIRARQRHRRRAVTIRTVAVTGTAAVAAVATLAATGATQPGGTLPVQTTAFVFRHSEAALTAAGRGRLILRAAFTSTRALPLQELITLEPEPYNNDVTLDKLPIENTTVWLYRNQILTEGFSPRGQLAAVIGQGPGSQPAGTPATVSVLDPVRHNWYHPLRPPLHGRVNNRSCTEQGTGWWLAQAAAPEKQMTELISKALSCHLFRPEGRQVVDGIRARRLAATPGLLRQLSIQAGIPAKTMSLFLDPATFLPVRLAMGDQGRVDYTWLKPTPAHLSLLRLKVPAGFHSIIQPFDTSLSWEPVYHKQHVPA